MANVGALRVAEQEEKPHRHPPNKDKSQWDRNWVRVLFIHGQPSIKELFPEKHVDTETHRRWKKTKKKQTHPGRQGDKYRRSSILRTALHSHSNSAASGDFESQTCFVFLSPGNIFTSVPSGGALSKWNLTLATDLTSKTWLQFFLNKQAWYELLMFCVCVAGVSALWGGAGKKSSDGEIKSNVLRPETVTMNSRLWLVCVTVIKKKSLRCLFIPLKIRSQSVCLVCIFECGCVIKTHRGLDSTIFR